MSWTYRDVQTFPGLYGNVIIEAIANLTTPRILFTETTEGNSQRKAQHFRWFRWCLRQKPNVNPVLSAYELNYQLRVQTDFIEDRYVTFLTAKPTKVSEIAELNPELSSLIAECQP